MNKNKIILVTGASSGIGSATVKRLLKEGYTVVGVSRNGKSEEFKNDCHFVNLDVTDYDKIPEKVSGIVDRFGKIDVLINCAGAGISGPIEEISENEMNWQMDVNFFGSVRMIKAVLPNMRKNKNGLIINVSSIGGLIGLPFEGMYSASKFAIEGISEALEKELNPFNISVVVIQPGDVATPFTANRVFNKKNGNGSPYSENFKKAINQIEKDENGGISPEEVAKKITKIIRMKNPSHKYIVAAWDQKLAVMLKKILPPSIFSSIIRKHYQI